MICPECGATAVHKTMIIDGRPGTYLLCGECFWGHRVGEELQSILDDVLWSILCHRDAR